MKAVLLTVLLMGAAGPAMAQSAISYFPVDLAQRVSCTIGFLPGSMPVISEVEKTSYSYQLSVANEPSLSSPKAPPDRGDGDRLRFTWLRSFDPPVIIRIDGVGTKAPRLVAKQLTGKGGYVPGAFVPGPFDDVPWGSAPPPIPVESGSINLSLDRVLTPEEDKRLREALQAARIAELPPNRCDMVSDGATWLVELVDNQGYHLVKRQSPKDGAVRELGLILLGLTGWKLDPIY